MTKTEAEQAIAELAPGATYRERTNDLRRTVGYNIELPDGLMLSDSVTITKAGIQAAQAKMRGQAVEALERWVADNAPAAPLTPDAGAAIVDALVADEPLVDVTFDQELATGAFQAALRAGTVLEVQVPLLAIAHLEEHTSADGALAGGIVHLQSGAQLKITAPAFEELWAHMGGGK